MCKLLCTNEIEFVWSALLTNKHFGFWQVLLWPTKKENDLQQILVNEWNYLYLFVFLALLVIMCVCADAFSVVPHPFSGLLFNLDEICTDWKWCVHMHARTQNTQTHTHITHTFTIASVCIKCKPRAKHTYYRQINTKATDISINGKLKAFTLNESKWKEERERARESVCERKTNKTISNVCI